MPTTFNLDEYYPMDIGQGMPANTYRWRKMALLWQCDGVVGNYANQLNVASTTVTGGAVTIQTGALYIHGYYGELINAAGYVISPVGTNGTIVAGVDMNQQIVSIYYRDGIVDYGSIPASYYQQDQNKWEIPLWLVSGTTLIDLRTMITPSAGSGWWNTVAGPFTVATSTTLQQNFLTCRVPYATKAMLRGELLLTFSDASQAQTAACSITYQQGQTDQQSSPVITPSTTAGTMMGPYNTIIPLSGLINVTQGKKLVGWRVTAGTGPQISVATLIASLLMWNVPASN